MIFAPLLVASLLLFLQLRSGAAESWAVAAVAAAAFAYVIDASGRLLLAAAGARDLGPGAAYASGLLATCLAVYALTLALPLTAAAAFGIAAVVALGAEVLAARRRDVPARDPRALGGFALCVALTAAWCSAPASAYEALGTGGVLPVWSDYFFHGGLISQFGDVRALGRGSIYLADHPSSFYHFASYAAAAALAGMLDQPGLPLAASAWLPLGFLAMLAGAFTLGQRLAGPAGGIAAAAALAMLPDASTYGLRNGLFSFHWTLMAHPGAGYALGAAFLSLALLDRWSVQRCRSALVASCLLAASMLLFRAHIFLLFVPAWVATASVISVRSASRRRRAAWLAAGVLVGGAVAASAILAGGAYWRFSGIALPDFLSVVHLEQEPTAYGYLYHDLVLTLPPLLALAAGIGLAILAALGAFVALLPAAALLARRVGALRPIDAACGYLLLCWLLLMLLAPKPWHGEATDLIHRPFVLAYTACALWTLCLLLRVFALRPGPARWQWAAALAAALLALPAIIAGADSMAQPKFRWGAADAAVRVPAGLPEAAAFLRARALPGDTFAAAGLSEKPVTFDLSTQLCSLTGVPAYLSRPHMEMIKDAPRRRVAAARLAALQEVDGMTDHRHAMERLGSLNIQWYVAADDGGPRWDPQRRRAAFNAGTVAVYATRGKPSRGALHDQVRVRNAQQVVAHEAAHLAEFRARELLVGIAAAHLPAAVER